MISDADKKRISEAIRNAEAKTSGELFCVIAGASSEYRHAPLIWSVAIALITPIVLALLTQWSPVTIYLYQLGAFIAAMALLSPRAIRFHLVPRRAKHARAHVTALRQFLAQGLQNTQQRTGILIFASVAERYAEIVADAGINAKVSQETWDQAIATLIAGIKQGRPGDGFIGAIEQCGTVLAAHFPPGSMNRNEISDKLVEI
ncbi:MAG: TPM domain-containing protein [Rhizobiales bacterium]|nr:TPM domain-containing protein [Hyphomicrobiales bacterium]